MQPEQLFTQAVGLALRDPEVVEALQRFDEPSYTVMGQLRTALDDATDEILAQVGAQLRALRSAEALLVAVINQDRSAIWPVSDDDAELLNRLRAGDEEVDELDTELHELEQDLTQPGREHDDMLKGRVSSTRVKLETARAERNGLQDELRARRLSRSAEAASEPAAPPRLREAYNQLEAARRNAERAVLEQGVLPFCRQWLNARLKVQTDRRYRTSLDGATAHGLAELVDPRFEISTASRERLERLIAHMPGGSIGVSGPRGSGKSTLIRSFCPEEDGVEEAGVFSVVLDAPVRYAPLEFIQHLFLAVCRKTLPDAQAREAVEQSVNARDRLRQRARRDMFLGWAAGMAIGFAGLVALLIGLRASDLSRTEEEWLLAGALGLGTLVSLRTLRGEMREVFARGPLTLLAGLTTTALLLSAGVRWEVALGASGAVAVATLAVTQLHGLGVRQLMEAAIITSGTAGGCALVAAAIAGTELPDAATAGVGLLMVSALAVPVVSMFEQRLEDRKWVSSQARPLSEEWAASRRRAARRLGLRLAFGLATFGLLLISLAIADRLPNSGVTAGTTLMLIGGVIAEHARTMRVRAGNAWQGEDRFERRAASPPRETPMWLDGEMTKDVEILQAEAADRYAGLRYLRTTTVDRGGKAGLEIGVGSAKLTAERSGSTGVSTSEQALALPELVAELKGFLAQVEVHTRRIVIGIDELDKMSTPEEAERFLNDIKSIFGIRNVYFLIAVSEDAVAAFERRGMPFRDIFDSTFDEVVRVGHLPFDGTVALLDRRTVDVARPFAFLCHALAGGLPRDVIRLARLLFATREALGTDALGTLSREITEAELLAKRDGTVTTTRQLGAEPAAAAVVNWLGAEPPSVDVADFRDQLARAPHLGVQMIEETAQVRALARLTGDFVAYWYLSVTVNEVLEVAARDGSWLLLEEDGAKTSVDQLASARQALAIDGQLAWHRISVFRDAWKLDVLPPFWVRMPDRQEA